MNRKINLDIAIIKILYGRYREHLPYIGVIIVCLLLFIVIIVPQVKNFNNARKEKQERLTKLKVLKNNLNVLASLDEGTLDLQLQTLVLALPVEKDFAGILNALSVAAVRAGVALGDFEFKVGSLSKTQATSAKFPSLELTLNIGGGARGAVKFISELYKTLPLAQVTNINVSAGFSTITTAFYYKPLPSVRFNDQVPLRKISSENLTLINKISSWKTPTVELSASPSATPF